jgi:LCCL domain
MNYKNEIGANSNKIMKQKPASLTVVFFMFLYCLMVSAVSAQEGWKIVPIAKETKELYEKRGLLVTEEKHTDGRKRTTMIEFFPGTKTPRYEQVVTKNGALTIAESKTWNEQREQIAYTEEFFDQNGKRYEGRKWSYSVDGNGKIVGAKTEEKYEPETDTWKIKEISETSFGNQEIPNSTIVSNLNNPEIFAIEWETGLDYFLHFNEAAKQNYYNFKPITLRCPPNPEKQYPTWAVYGGPTEYHNWSVPCASAVHAGKITFESGGVITIQYVTYEDPSKQPKLAASTRNGVTSGEHEDWTSARFRFVNNGAL